MLRKKLAAIIVAAVLTLYSSNAFAIFADRELIRVVYDGMFEHATDLGTIDTISTRTLQPITIPASNNPAYLYATYFAYDRNTRELWVSGSTISSFTWPEGTLAAGRVDNYAPVVNIPSTRISTNISYLYQYYNSLTPDENGVVTTSQSDPHSYSRLLNSPIGSMNYVIRNNSSWANVSLASLADGTANSVTQGLYYINDVGYAGIGVKVADITTYVTPIPPAFLLMGSGIVGLFGMRKKLQQQVA
jgi:hypothetical protein